MTVGLGSVYEFPNIWSGTDYMLTSASSQWGSGRAGKEIARAKKKKNEKRLGEEGERT